MELNDYSQIWCIFDFTYCTMKAGNAEERSMEPSSLSSYLPSCGAALCLQLKKDELLEKNFSLITNFKSIYAVMAQMP